MSESRGTVDQLEAEVQSLRSKVAELEQQISRSEDQEAKLRESQDLYESLVQAIPLCVARKDLLGRYIFVNRTLADLIGKPAHELVGKTVAEVYPAEVADKYRGDDELVLRSGTLQEFDETFFSAEGERRRAHVLKTPIFDAEGKISGVQLVFWDITEQRATEEKLAAFARQLEIRTDELLSFAHAASHDMRAPMRTAVSFCNLLRSRCADQLDEKSLQFVDMIVQGARRLESMLDGLLDWSRVYTHGGQFRPTDLNLVVAEAIANLDSLIAQHDAEISVSPLPELKVDEPQMVRVFQNLIENAIKYRGERPPRIAISAERLDGMWRFAVRDYGIGIAGDMLDRVFRIFQRLHTEEEIPGQGLGLAICRNVIQRHHGRIWADSPATGGAIFWFDLPAL